MPPLSILLVEDDAQFRAAFASAIESAPDMRLIGAAADATQAFDILEREQPDVLLTDLGLPDRSGVEIIRHVAGHWPDCDIMVVTIFGDEQHVLESIEAGATGYLLKDMPADEFLHQIRTLKAGGSPISPVIARRLLNRFREPLPPTAAAAAGDDTALSERESSVLALIAKGFSFDEIAKLLDLSRHTVTTYVKRIYRKLQVRSKTEAVYEARRLGLVRD